MVISQSLIESIEEKLKKIQDSPEYFSERRKVFEEELRHNTDIHSFWIEHPDMRKTLLAANNVSSERELIDTAKKKIKQIRKGWNYLTCEALKEHNVGVLGYLKPEVIQTVGKFVEHDSNKFGFRKNEVFSPFKRYQPIPYDLIEKTIKGVCDELRSRYKNPHANVHPIEIAAEIHLKIAGIQPFNDGNKRTARLMERRVLEGFGYPTAFIPFGEREIYLDLLEQSLIGLNHYKIEAQKPFMDYIGGKVACALDEILDDLKIE
jgi:Fic family protein